MRLALALVALVLVGCSSGGSEAIGRASSASGVETEWFCNWGREDSLFDPSERVLGGPCCAYEVLKVGPYSGCGTATESCVTDSDCWSLSGSTCQPAPVLGTAQLPVGKVCTTSMLRRRHAARAYA